MQNLSTFRCVGQIFVSFQYDIKVRSFLINSLGDEIVNSVSLLILLLLDLKVYLFEL
jgi:hypothetical protein